jgi:hypothetical protein
MIHFGHKQAAHMPNFCVGKWNLDQKWAIQGPRAPHWWEEVATEMPKSENEKI